MSISDSKSASVKCQLREATLAHMQDRQQLVPMSSHRGRISTDGLVEQILNQGSTVRGADVKAVLDNLGKAIFAVCSRGEAVSIPELGIITPRVGGVANRDGTWVSGPYVYLNMRFENSLSAAIQDKAQIEIVEATTVMPSITTVVDVASGTRNESLTSGSLGSIKGKNLRFDATKSDEGLYLIPAAGGEAVKVALFERNSPVKLTFQWPSGLISETQYKVQVRARIGSSKTLRESAIGAILTVV